MNTYEEPGTLLGAVNTGSNTLDKSPCLCRAHVASLKGFWIESKHEQNTHMNKLIMFFSKWVKSQK